MKGSSPAMFSKKKRWHAKLAVLENYWTGGPGPRSIAIWCQGHDGCPRSDSGTAARAPSARKKNGEFVEWECPRPKRTARRGRGFATSSQIRNHVRRMRLVTASWASWSESWLVKPAVGGLHGKYSMFLEKQNLLLGLRITTPYIYVPCAIGGCYRKVGIAAAIFFFYINKVEAYLVSVVNDFNQYVHSALVRPLYALIILHI